MQVKRLTVLILLMVLVFVLSGCTQKYSSSSDTQDQFSGKLNIPDKIIIYAEGKQKQITKNSDKFEQVLFDRINQLVEIRIPKHFSTARCEISDADLKEVHSYAVEFVYNKPQNTTINNGKAEKIEFTEILFPLSKKWENITFIKQKDNYAIPVGLHENLDYLVKASIDLLKK